MNYEEQVEEVKEKVKSYRKYWLLGGLALLVVYLLTFCVRIIGVGEVGVVTRFGNVNREVNSGINLKLPWPVESLNKFDVKTQKEEADVAAATKDLQDVNTKLAVNYNLEKGEVQKLFRTVGVDWKERIVEPAIQESFKSVSAKYTAAELITDRQKVKQEMLNNLSDRLSSNSVRVTDVSIVNFQFSAAFSTSIEQKQVAQQNAERANFELESARKQAEAQRTQQTSISQELLQKWAIEKWNGVMPLYSGSGTVFNIPLK